MPTPRRTTTPRKLSGVHSLHLTPKGMTLLGGQGEPVIWLDAKEQERLRKALNIHYFYHLEER